MAQRADIERYRENWQDEVDSAAEYSAMAESKPDPKIAKVNRFSGQSIRCASAGFCQLRARPRGHPG